MFYSLRVDPVLPEDQVSQVAALDHPLTRAAYLLVMDGGRTSRDDAAAALQVPRSVAAFHLDKLVDAGLLQPHYERVSGRSGPGAGRPAKLYERSDREVELSLPARRYELAGTVLTDAVSRATAEGAAVADVLPTVAAETGRRLGEHVARAGAPTGLLASLVECGYSPEDRGGEIVLRNCPFHNLAERHRSLVCGMNVDLLAGVVAGAGADGEHRAELRPEPGYCCVRLVRRA
jgi:predicted ArsR family transcriptional regulator